MVFQLIYVSSAAREMRAGDLSELLAQAREVNKLQGITGLLIYHHGNFFQALEGPRDRVEACFDRIRRDPRHYGIIRVLAEEVGERTFPGWRMAYRRPDQLSAQCRSDLVSLGDLLPDLQARKASLPIAERLAASFLTSFAEGAGTGAIS